VKTWPGSLVPKATTTSLVPSADEAAPFKEPDGPTRRVQVAPESTEMWRPLPRATSFVASADDATTWRSVGPGCCVHVTPESMDVWMLPPGTKPEATSLVPSADDTTPIQNCDVPRCVHVVPESTDV
jgi:hypothetical protein